jgi:hypothetical protein
MASSCQNCGVVGLSAHEVHLAMEILGEGWETMCIVCAKSYAELQDENQNDNE